MASQTTSTVLATATTWISKAVWRLRSDAGNARNKSARDVAVWEATKFIQKTLLELEMLVPLLDWDDDNYDFDDIEKALADLSKQLRDRRRAVQLSNVEGRTPEETAAFRAKAAELAEGLAS